MLTRISRREQVSHMHSTMGCTMNEESMAVINMTSARKAAEKPPAGSTS